MNLEKLDLELIENVQAAFDIYLTGIEMTSYKQEVISAGQKPSLAYVIIKHVRDAAYSVQQEKTKEVLLNLYCDMDSPMAPHVRNKLASLLQHREVSDVVLLSSLTTIATVFDGLQHVKPLGYKEVNKELRYSKKMKERVEAFHQNFLVGHFEPVQFNAIPDTLRNKLCAPYVVDRMDKDSKPFLLSILNAVYSYMNEAYEENLLLELYSEIEENNLDKNIL
ncbi:hypothetical protein [Vibrio harveyi]|uniref:hypothetical protein n=1 Tax=Vibrio harveyi TaxID=669 RepID=UPI003CF66180